MAPPDRDYYQRRIEQEALAAEKAASPAAQRVHRQLQEQYAKKLALQVPVVSTDLA
jgi:hypothetical protein